MKKYVIKVNGISYDVEVEEVNASGTLTGGAASHTQAGGVTSMQAGGYSAPAAAYAPAASMTPAPAAPAAQTASAAPAAQAAPAAAAAASQQQLQKPRQSTDAPAPAPSGSTQITAPMPGTIVKVNVNAGDIVKRAQPVLVLEAMKMENDIVSPVDGKVLAIYTKQGASVNTGDLLISIG